MGRRPSRGFLRALAWAGKGRITKCAAHLHTDLMATCAELLGARLPANAGEDSASILPALRSADRAPLRDAVVHHSIQGMFSIRQGSWKLAFCPGSGGWGAPGDADAKRSGLPDVQLYDLSADIGETRNVHAKNPEVVKRLTKLLESYVDNGRSTPGARQANDAAIQLIKPIAANAKK